MRHKSFWWLSSMKHEECLSFEDTLHQTHSIIHYVTLNDKTTQLSYSIYAGYLMSHNIYLKSYPD